MAEHNLQVEFRRLAIEMSKQPVSEGARRGQYCTFFEGDRGEKSED